MGVQKTKNMKYRVYFFLLLFNISAYSQSKIEQSKSELSSSSNNSNSGNSSNSKSSNNDDDDDFNIWIEIFGAVFKYVLIGDYKHEDHLSQNLTDYPYFNDESGNYKKQLTFETFSEKKTFRFDVQNNFLYSDSKLFGNHLKAKIRPFQYFYFQTDYHQLYEKNKATQSTDQLALFYFNLGYDRIRFEKFNFGWTIGASYVGNDVRKSGFSVGLNTEAFIGNNISLLVATKWSSINGYPVNTYEFEARYHKKRYFASLGYQHLKIATPIYNFMSFGGGIYLN